MTAPLTHAECLARLAACEPMARGERGATVSLVRCPKEVLNHWRDLTFAAGFNTVKFTGFNAAQYARDEWRRRAAPLRRVREERRNWRVKFEDARARLVVGDAAKEHGIAEASYARGVVDGTWDAHMFHNVGAALLGFFTDLAILVRKTPAPCPWCGGDATLWGAHMDYPKIGCSMPEHNIQMSASCNDDDAVALWNRVAIPAAFARLKDGP